MKLLKTIFAFFTNPIADLTGGYRERKRIASEMAASIATAECNLKLARFTAETNRLTNTENNDTDYDMQVLKNRKNTFMDEIIIAFFLALFAMHFIEETQPIMKSGWLAMGYQGAPWYFEFIIVGIAVSTLGLMRLFRIFFRAKEKDKPDKHGER
jgi:hypothetical protein